MATDYSTLPSTRAEAKRLGAKRYYTGQPCKHGHVSHRATVNGLCGECGRLKSIAQYHADIEAGRAKVRAYAAEHRDKRLDAKKARLDLASPDRVVRRTQLAEEMALQAAALNAEASQYQSLRPCSHGHVGARFALDRKCVECNLISCRKRNGYDARQAEREERRAAREVERAERTAPWHAAKNARQDAIAKAALTYLGQACKYGHGGLRYTGHGTCVTCAAEVARSDEKKEYDRLYLKANYERICARGAKWRDANRELVAANAKRWRDNNPEKRRVISMTNKSRRRALIDKGDSAEAIRAWANRIPKVCHWCSVKCAKSYHVDHYVPLSKGGKHEVSNLVIACPPCNLKKSAKDPYEFARQVGRLF